MTPEFLRDSDADADDLNIDRLLLRCEAALQKSDNGRHIDEALDDIHEDLATFQDAESFRFYLLNYLRERAGSEEAMCSCGWHMCPLRNATVPDDVVTHVREGWSLSRAVVDWVEEHPGDGQALLDAVTAYHEDQADLKARIFETFTEAVAAAGGDPEEAIRRL